MTDTQSDIEQAPSADPVEGADPASEETGPAHSGEGEQTPEPSGDKPEDAKEEKPAEDSQEEPPTDRHAAKFAALARKERKIQQARQELRSLEAELLPLREARSLLAKDPIAALEKMGIDVQNTYTQLTRKYLDKGDASGDIAALQTELQELRRSLQQRDITRQQTEFTDHIRHYVAENPKYTWIPEKGAHGLVLEVMELAQQNENRMLSISEAADMVEAHFEQEAAEYERLKAKRSKATNSANGAQQQSSGQTAASHKPKTLSNGHAQTAPPAIDDDEGPLDITERARWMVATGRVRMT